MNARAHWEFSWVRIESLITPHCDDDTIDRDFDKATFEAERAGPPGALADTGLCGYLPS